MRWLCLWSVLLASAAVLSAVELQQTVERPAGVYSYVELHFRCDEPPDTHDLFARWTYRGGMRDGRMPMGDGVTLTEASGELIQSDGRLTGSFVHQLGEDSGRQRAVVEVDAAVDPSGQISGSCIIAGAAGRVQGSIVTAAELRQVNSLPSAANWPTFLGPIGAGTNSLPSDAPILPDPTLARRRWHSEPIDIGMSIGSASRRMYTWDDAMGRRTISGAASPVLAEGRVFLFYYVPVAELPSPRQQRFSTGHQPYEDALMAMATAAGVVPDEVPVRAREKIWEGVDDVMVALDAATGELLWRTVTHNRGYNLQHHKEGPFNMSPAVHDGRVFAIGMRGDLYAFDAATGEPLWNRSLGGERTHLSATIMALPGVVVAPGTRYWQGFDPLTGEDVWTSDLPVVNATVAVWRHAGQDYLIGCTGNEAIWNADLKHVICFDSDSGDELWRVPLEPAPSTIVSSGRGLGPGGMVIHGDRMIAYLVQTSGDSRSERRANATYSVICWRLTLDGPVPVWSLPYEDLPDGSTPGFEHVPVIVHDRFAVLGNMQVVDIDNETVVDRGDGIYPGNGGYLLGMGDHVLVRRDGTHGDIGFGIYHVAEDGSISDRTPDGEWRPPGPGTTSYHHPIMYPVADGRVFVRMADGITCLDFRVDDPGEPLLRTIGLDVRGRPGLRAGHGTGPGADLPATFSGLDGYRDQRFWLRAPDTDVIAGDG